MVSILSAALRTITFIFGSHITKFKVDERIVTNIMAVFQVKKNLPSHLRFSFLDLIQSLEFVRTKFEKNCSKSERTPSQGKSEKHLGNFFHFRLHQFIYIIMMILFWET